MLAWALEIVFYAALAVGVTWVSRRHAMVVVGLALILCSIVTNVAYFGASFGSRLTLELMQTAAVASAARIAFRASRSWPAAIVTGLSAIDAALCGVIALVPVAPGWEGVIFGWGTNATFFLQCLCVGTPGVRNALVDRGYSFSRRRRLDHAHIPVDGRRNEGTGQ